MAGTQRRLSVTVARAVAVRLAKHIVELEQQLGDHERQLTELAQISQAALLLDEKGFQAISAAKCLPAS